MGITVLQVDAFAASPFTGNPAAVCLLNESKEAQWMQSVAAEMNLAETAYVLPRENPTAGFDLRWFTPTIEVDLCGHATLATAHGLWELGLLPRTEEARFHTRSGLLTCRKEGAWIWMDFPSRAATPISPPRGLIESLGMRETTRVLYVGVNPAAFFVVVDSEAAVRAANPDFVALGKLPGHGAIVTAQADPGSAYEFVSRFFAPGAGVNEDPVTGSAHCALAPYWSEQLGRTDLTGYQASTRGGIVRVERRGKRVLLGGQAVTVLQGVLV